jgi:adenosylcobinamide-phosphate guanylyltransferase
MAGGKGSRLKLSEEKPMVKVCGKPIIERVLTSLQHARHVDSIVVAVSDYTPTTAQYVAKFPVSIIKTSGRDYILDMQQVIKDLGLKTVLTVAADLPLVTGEIIDKIVERYERCGKPALVVVSRVETKSKLGLSSEYAFEEAENTVVPVGINLVDGQRICEEELEQEVCLLDTEEVALNINTLKELGIAEKLLKKKNRLKRFARLNP